MANIDLSQYPAPQVLEPVNYETVLAEIKEAFLLDFPEDDQTALDLSVPTRAAMTALMDLEGNLIVKVLQAYAYHASRLYARVNEAAKATMLPYAVGADLDNLAAFYFVQRKAGEIDADFRSRIILAVDGFSTAGPRGAYEFHALSADDDVKHVSVASPTPGDVVVTVLSKASGVPDQAVLDAVEAALSDEDVRPLTDNLTVQAATIVDYALEATIWTYGSVDSAVVVEAARVAALAYVDEVYRLGYDVTVSGIHNALHQPGVQRAVITTPAAGIVNDTSTAARCTGVTVNYGGIDV